MSTRDRNSNLPFAVCFSISLNLFPNYSVSKRKHCYNLTPLNITRMHSQSHTSLYSVRNLQHSSSLPDLTGERSSLSFIYTSQFCCFFFIILRNSQLNITSVLHFYPPFEEEIVLLNTNIFLLEDCSVNVIPEWTFSGLLILFLILS